MLAGNLLTDLQRDGITSGGCLSFLPPTSNLSWSMVPSFSSTPLTYDLLSRLPPLAFYQDAISIVIDLEGQCAANQTSEIGLASLDIHDVMARDMPKTSAGKTKIDPNTSVPAALPGDRGSSSFAFTSKQVH